MRIQCCAYHRLLWIHHVIHATHITHPATNSLTAHASRDSWAVPLFPQSDEPCVQLLEQIYANIFVFWFLRVVVNKLQTSWNVLSFAQMREKLNMDQNTNDRLSKRWYKHCMHARGCTNDILMIFLSTAQAQYSLKWLMICYIPQLGKSRPSD